MPSGTNIRSQWATLKSNQPQAYMKKAAANRCSRFLFCVENVNAYFCAPYPALAPKSFMASSNLYLLPYIETL